MDTLLESKKFSLKYCPQCLPILGKLTDLGESCCICGRVLVGEIPVVKNMTKENKTMDSTEFSVCFESIIDNF